MLDPLELFLDPTAVATGLGVAPAGHTAIPAERGEGPVRRLQALDIHQAILDSAAVATSEGISPRNCGSIAPHHTEGLSGSHQLNSIGSNCGSQGVTVLQAASMDGLLLWQYHTRQGHEFSKTNTQFNLCSLLQLVDGPGSICFQNHIFSTQQGDC
jgi:hypothetical protein